MGKLLHVVIEFGQGRAGNNSRRMRTRATAAYEVTGRTGDVDAKIEHKIHSNKMYRELW